MQDEISWNDNTRYDIYNPYVDISPLEPCDAPKMRNIVQKMIDVQTSRLRNAGRGIRTVKHIGNEQV